MHGGEQVSSHDSGIIPRATMALAKAKSRLEANGWHYAIDASSVEVYDEHVYDLLANGGEKASRGAPLQLRDQNISGRLPLDCGPSVEGVTTHPIDLEDPEAISRLMKRAAASRATRATAVNDRSSRSHAVFWLRLRGSHTESAQKTAGSLVLADLAGSERVGRSGAVQAGTPGDQLREACSINRSLSCLVDVFVALARDGPRDRAKPTRSHVP